MAKLLMESHEIFSIVIGAVGLSAAAMFSAIAAWLTNRNSKIAETINDAVNHRHEGKHGTDPPKLYDAVMETRGSIIKVHENLGSLDDKIDELAKSNQKDHQELLEWKKGYETAGVLDTPEKVTAFVEGTNKRLEKLERGKSK